MSIPAHGGWQPSPTPLEQPLYGAGAGEAFGRFWRKYAVFSGRASRSEYWWWFLIGFGINLVLKIVDIATSGGYTAAGRTLFSPGDLLGYVWGLAILVPGLAVSVRRLHDTDRSGLYLLIGLIPLVGTIILLVMLATDSRPGGHRFDRYAGPGTWTT